MWCGACNNHLSTCTCPDIDERLAGLSEVLVFRKCLRCGKHYARCTCDDPAWGTNKTPPLGEAEGEGES